MADLKKYSFNRHSEKYFDVFKKEKIRLKKIFPDANIEHMGSSAVKGLGGKKIVDVLVSVPKKEIENSIKILQKKGYLYKPPGGTEERKFFKRQATKEMQVHIQLTHHDSYTWRASVAVRDYLNKHKEAREEYAQVKQDAVRHAKGKGDEYRRFKKPFLDKLEKKALKEYFAKKSKLGAKKPQS